MSFEFESFRPKKYTRSRFLDGDFLLSQEASDIQLELLEYARDIVQNLIGDVAVGNGWLVQQSPFSISSLIVRPGEAYYNGLNYEMDSGLDPKISADASQGATLGDVGGKILNFGSKTSGYYRIIAQAQEEAVTALQDPFLQGAAVPETTEQKRRIIYDLVAVSCDSKGHMGNTTNTVNNTSGIDPMNFTETSTYSAPQRSDFFSYNDFFQIPVPASPPSITPTTDTLGSTAVVAISNSDGLGNTIFPPTQAALISQIFTGGFLVDSDGTYFYITAVQIQTGPDQILFTISQELAVPAGTGNQPNPNFYAGFKYGLVATDINFANPSTGIPIGTRNYAIANVYWNGTDFSTAPFGFSSSEGGNTFNIQDLRVPGGAPQPDFLARKQNWMLTNPGIITWIIGPPDTLTWASGFIVKDPSNTSLQYQIPAGDTFTLFGSSLDEDEVLYAVIPNNTSGAVNLTLQKDARGTGQLASTDPSKLFILAYRSNNIVYFLYDSLSLGDGDSGRLGMGLIPDTIVKVDLLDTVDTSLPSISPAVIDGQTVASGDLVLFTALTSPAPNRVYQASISGSVITWTVQPAFPTSTFTEPYDPINGNLVQILRGLAYADQLALFNGTSFQINNVVRNFSADLLDYFEQDGIVTSTLLNNSSGHVFSVTNLGSENMVVDFSLFRGSSPILKEAGTLYITSNGLNANFSTGGAVLGTTGISFFTTVSGGNLILGYNADSTTGMDAIMKYSVKRWSDYAGGPEGLPSYTAYTTFGGGYVNSAYNMSQAVGPGYQMSQPVNVLGKTQVSLIGWNYFPGLNSGAPAGDLEVVVNGQIIPRFLSGITTDAYYTEVNNTTIEFWTDIITPENVSIEIIKRQGTIDATSQALSRIAGFYDAIVGSPAQVALGAATYSSLQTAINNALAGDKILVLQGTYTENISVSKNVYIEGKGHGCTVTGTFDVPSGSDYSTIKNLRFDGDFSIEANGCFVRECFQSMGHTITDSGTANSKLIIVE